MVEREGRGGATWVGGTEACSCVEDGVESGIVETGAILVEEEDVLEEGELAGGKQEVVAGLREASEEEAVKEEAEEVEVEGAGGWNGGRGVEYCDNFQSLQVDNESRVFHSEHMNISNTYRAVTATAAGGGNCWTPRGNSANGTSWSSCLRHDCVLFILRKKII